jgi:iron complex outermembrane receptor protein
VTFGVDVEAQWDDRREFVNQNGEPFGNATRDQEDHVAGIGPFAQLRGEAGAFAVTLGARYDAVHFRTTDRRPNTNQSGERTVTALSPSAGVTWASGATTVFGNIGTAFQSPTTTELINTPPTPGEPCCPAGFNPDLDPQRATSVELGVRGSPHPRARYEAVVYHMRLRDALVPFQVEGVQGREFFRNAGRTRHQGVELSASLLPHERVLANVAYTHTDVRFREDGTVLNALRGNRMPGVPPHRIFGALTWTAAAFRITGEVDHNAAYPVNDANDAPDNPAATVVSMRASTRLALRGIDIAPFAAINNIFDERYFSSVVINAAGGRYYEPAPTRNVYLGASIALGGWRGQ